MERKLREFSEFMESIKSMEHKLGSCLSLVSCWHYCDKWHYVTDTYDAILCVGVLVGGHLSEETFPEIIGITKPGGKLTQCRLCIVSLLVDGHE